MAWLPAIEGVIRRRILVNYRVDPAVAQRLVPACFRPKLHEGYAIAGICLIRLEGIRPRRLPGFIGLSSENAAHRIAVLWNDKQGQTCEGVFVPRRDTDSRLNCLVGGRVFPGEHHRATFRIEENGGDVEFSMKSRDGSAAVELAGQESATLPESSIFRSLSESSAFFEAGSLGYSMTRNACRLDGLTLETNEWRVQPLEIKSVYSSYFGDRSLFPASSAQFDHALMMRNIAHQWRSAPDLFI